MNVVFETLSYMSKLDRMNFWFYKKVRPYLGKRILEAGCGNGNFPSWILDQELVIALDNDEVMLNEMKTRFFECPSLKISKYDLADSKIKELAAHNIDTIICINTLEHINDDVAALRNFNSILNNGNLILIVPAFSFLFSSLDKAAGHYRRYSLKELTEKINKSGFAITKNMYANFFGIIGWFLNGKILKRERLSKVLLSFFDFLTPAFEVFEKLTGPPIGLSIILVCKKRQ